MKWKERVTRHMYGGRYALQYTKESQILGISWYHLSHHNIGSKVLEVRQNASCSQVVARDRSWGGKTTVNVVDILVATILIFSSA